MSCIFCKDDGTIVIAEHVKFTIVNIDDNCKAVRVNDGNDELSHLIIDYCPLCGGKV